MTATTVRRRLARRRPRAPGRRPDAAHGARHLHRQPRRSTACSHLAFVRSPVAHAEIRSIDTSDARAMPGVVGVYTADDLDFPEHIRFMQLHPAAVRARARAGPGALRRRHRRGGRRRDARRRRSTRPRRSIVDYDPLARGRRHGATRSRPTRRCCSRRSAPTSSWRHARPTATTRSRAPTSSCAAGSRTSGVAVVPMEGAAIAVVPGDDGDGHELTVYLACQMPHMNRGGLAGNFGVEPDTRAADRAARRRFVRRQALGAGRRRRRCASRASSAVR